MPCIYAPPAKFEKKNSIINNQVFFERGMSSDAKVLVGAINAIKSCAPNWVIVQKDIQNRLEFSKERMRKAMNDAVKFGYLKIVQVKQKKGTRNEKNKGIGGQFYRNAFFFSLDKDFTDEAFVNNTDFNALVDSLGTSEEALPVEASKPLPCLPSTAEASPDSKPIPMPNKPMPNLKALKGNASLFKKPRALAVSPSQPPAGKSRSRKHPRPEHEENAYQWLLGIELLYKTGSPDIDTLSVLANKYPAKKLEDTYFHLLHKINEKGVKPRSNMALFRHLLDNEHNCRGSDAELNEAFAKQFVKEMGWHTLEFKEKYVIDRNYTSKDISFNLEPATFREVLGNLYMNLNPIGG